MRWSIFCRVVDNHGDAGVCLRLARELHARGETVQLFIDDDRALHWMGGLDGIALRPWPADDDAPTLGEVLIEAFGCELPPGVQGSWARQPGRAWINLEYLSAEPYVERSHGLPSPVMSGPAAGCVKRFCYPGFTAATGGLLRERAGFPAPGDFGRRPGERQLSLFCYPHAPLAALLQALGDAPTHLLVCGGIRLPEAPAAVRITQLPWLSQHDYDRLLAACDLNLVRGEDSFVRAQLAGKPLLWNIYPQQDGAHAAKLDAFLQLRGDDPEPWRVWNGLQAGPLSLTSLLAPPARAAALTWRDRLHRLPELVDTLQQWAAS
jgi:uncharacterized repeat protein (TIGR03837 family)